MPTKYVKPISLDDETAAEDVAAAENLVGETEPAESVETIFGVVRRPVTPEPRVQPENETRTRPFQVGELHGTVLPERWALLPFEYPEPGAPLTAEIAEAALHYSTLRGRANQALNDLTMFHKLLVWNGGIEIGNDIAVAERERIRRENRSFLEGVLKSHGFDVPTDEQISAWAEEDLKHVANKQSDRG
jgi:hypothetical protein